MSVSARALALGPKMPNYFKFLRGILIENPGAMYDPTNNPDGIMILTIAENNLTLDLLKNKIREPGEELPDGQYNYGNNSYFLKDLAAFFSRTFFLGRKVDPKNLIVGNGAGSVLNMISFTLCDPGDGIIIPSPYYPGFDLDLNALAGVVPIPANLQSSNNFDLDIAKLQEALDKAKGDNISVKALLLCSPNNPMGVIYSKQQLIDVINWTRSNKIHLIVDEIYALSCYNDDRKFISISAVLTDLGEDFGDYVHVVWSFSKDFSMSGYRVGILYSENRAVMDGMNSQGFFYMASNHTQHLLHKMVTDEKFIDTFVETNQRNLGTAYRAVTGVLKREAIPFVEGGAGFFILIDLRAYLEGNKDWEAEDVLWKYLALQCKVVFTPGSSMHVAEPGWFRCCFASYETSAVEKGLTNMAKMLKAKNVK